MLLDYAKKRLFNWYLVTLDVLGRQLVSMDEVHF